MRCRSEFESRARRPGYSPQYAARVVDHADGEQVIPQGQHYLDFLPVYRLRNDRDWLIDDQAPQLRELLDAYLTRMNDLPDRVRRAISISEGVVHTRVIERALNLVVIGLEAMLNTNRFQVTRQMVTRIPLLAAAVGGVDEAFADEMYDHRSRALHMARRCRCRPRRRSRRRWGRHRPGVPGQGRPATGRATGGDPQGDRGAWIHGGVRRRR